MKKMNSNTQEKYLEITKWNTEGGNTDHSLAITQTQLWEKHAEMDRQSSEISIVADNPCKNTISGTLVIFQTPWNISHEQLELNISGSSVLIKLLHKQKLRSWYGFF